MTEVKKKLCYTSPKVTTRQLCADRHRYGPQAKLCSHGGIQSVVCVLSGLDFKAAGGSTEVIVCPIILFALMTSIHCRHDVGALL